MTDPGRVVFLSYASQDAQAAQKICEALRAAAIEVFLDQSELRGGDAWDQKIRREIHDCALFVPLISAHSDARHEGYFRREWKLAVDRTADMSDRVAFLVPVVIDDTSDSRADVPERFRQVQWTRLPGGETPPEFVRRIEQLISGEVHPSTTAARAGLASRRPVRGAWLAVALAVAIALVAAYLLVEKRWGASLPPAAAFAPPPHSIAVLPFVNLSGDKEQEYFSDGLTEELLNSLSEISELQVAARTSAFSFKGTNTDIGTIARKLNVAAVLEGSVRRSGSIVRITTQLINAVTGFHLWSHTYDRDLGDVLKLETDIADAVASALKVSLLGNVATKIELGGTSNPAAFDAYLRGRTAHLAAHDAEGYQAVIAAFTEAIELDPNYALAFANRAFARNDYAEQASGALVRASFDDARADALKAIALAPDLAEAHMALAIYSIAGELDFSRGIEAYQRAVALAPGNARVLRNYAVFAVDMGLAEAGIAAGRRAVVLDPLNFASYRGLGQALYSARRYSESLGVQQHVFTLDREHPGDYAALGLTYYALADFEHARATCVSKPDDYLNQQCLAVTYGKLGQRANAERVLAQLKANGDDATYQYAEIYAQWGNVPKAIESLETAMRVRDPGLEFLKADPQLDPLRKEPRFQAIERELKFPN